MNYNKKAVQAIFGNKANLAQVIEDALYKLDEALDEDVSFEETMEQFLEEFQTIASDCVAETVLKKAIARNRIKHDSMWNSGDIQIVINHLKYIRIEKNTVRMFAALNVADYIKAHEIFQYMEKQYQRDYSTMDSFTVVDIIKYQRIVEGEPEHLDGIIDNLAEVAKKHVLNNALTKNLPSRQAEKPNKI